MDDDLSFKGCVTTTGAILGIIISLITIIQFFFKDSKTFLAAVAAFWNETFLGTIWPGVGNLLGSLFKNIVDGIAGFAQGSPFTPWWTAVLIFIAGGILKRAIESGYFYDSFDFKEIPFWAIPALLWILVFYGTASVFGIIVFVVIYTASSIGLDFLMENWAI